MLDITNLKASQQTHRTLYATVAQSKNCLFGLNTKIDLKI